MHPGELAALRHQDAPGVARPARAWRPPQLRAELAAAGCLAAKKVVEVLSWTHAALTAQPGEIADAEPGWLPAFDLAGC